MCTNRTTELNQSMHGTLIKSRSRQAISSGRLRLCVPSSVSFWLWTVLFALVMIAPVAAILRGSFEIAIAGSDDTRFGLDAWRQVFVEPMFLSAVVNTVGLTLATQFLALPIGIFIAWLIGRTDLPGRHHLEFCFWISFFLPALAVLQGWILAFDPHYGVANSAIQRFFGRSAPVLDIYSWTGIVFAHLVTTTISAKVMMLTPTFQNMDSRLEEAARVAGDGHFATLLRITIPVLAPAIAVAAIIGIMRSLESFEIELVLGGPRRIEVYSTLIYHLTRNDPINFAGASALGISVTSVLACLAVLSVRIGHGGRAVTVSGHSKSARIPLGPWKVPAFIFVATFAALLTVMPIAFLIASSVMTMFGFFSLESVWTASHWTGVVADPVFLLSLTNTLVLATGCAFVCVVVSIAIGYTVVRSPRAARVVLDVTSWVPFTVPGILLSLAMLWLILESGSTYLYGSTVSLIVTVALSTLTLGVQLIKGSLSQIHRELEEASWVVGTSTFETLWRIVLPLTARSIAVVAVMSFIAAARNIGHVALLVSSDNRPLSILQLEYMIDGRQEEAAVVGVVIVAATVLAALLARRLGSRIAPHA